MEQTQEAAYGLSVQFPLSSLKMLRKRFPADTAEASFRIACQNLVEQNSQGCHLSERGLSELASILAAERITSEEELISATRRRFNLAPNQVLIEIDPMLCGSMREAAESDGLPLAQVLANYFHQAFAYGWFNQHWESFWISFSKRQWEKMRECLEGLPLVAESILAALEDWKARKHRL